MEAEDASTRVASAHQRMHACTCMHAHQSELARTHTPPSPAAAWQIPGWGAPPNLRAARMPSGSCVVVGACSVFGVKAKCGFGSALRTPHTQSKAHPKPSTSNTQAPGNQQASVTGDLAGLPEWRAEGRVGALLSHRRCPSRFASPWSSPGVSLEWAWAGGVSQGRK
jgi:hypothetical protein